MIQAFSYLTMTLNLRDTMGLVKRLLGMPALMKTSPHCISQVQITVASPKSLCPAAQHRHSMVDLGLPLPTPPRLGSPDEEAAIQKGKIHMHIRDVSATPGPVKCQGDATMQVPKPRCRLDVKNPVPRMRNPGEFNAN